MFGLGVIVLQIFGGVMIFYGISADEATEFPFQNKRWPRWLLVMSMLFVAAGWPVILKNAVAAWFLVVVFTVGALYFCYKGKHTRA